MTTKTDRKPHQLAHMPPTCARAFEARLREANDEAFLNLLCSEEGAWWFATAVPDADIETQHRCVRALAPVTGVLLSGLLGGGGS